MTFRNLLGGAALACALAAPALAQDHEPGQTLLARERDTWTLEGKLVAEANALLRTPAARQELGDVKTGNETKVRAWLRAHRTDGHRDLAREFMKGLDRPTRELLDRVATPQHLAPEEVLMDYLTYEGLYDLALVRYGWRRYQAKQLPEATRALVEEFFANVKELPSATAGITATTKGHALEVSVFGAHVHAEVLESKIDHVPGVGAVGAVEWKSNYEAIRAHARGVTPEPHLKEVLAHEDGRYRVSYALELDEYQRDGATRPWATVLALTSADELADLYAGIAAAGGLEATAEVQSVDPSKLSSTGIVGTKEKGLTVKVTEVKSTESLMGSRARRGKFLVVVLEATSSFANELRAPAEWFKLEAKGAEYPELGVTWPGAEGNLHALIASSNARMLGLPYTTFAPGAKVELVLVFEVPRDLELAALRLGAREAALKVEGSK